MKAVKSILNKVLAANCLALCAVNAQASQLTIDNGVELGSVFLFSAGMIGLVAARKHMKQNAS